MWVAIHCIANESKASKFSEEWSLERNHSWESYGRDSN